jgi:hypothetical protein
MMSALQTENGGWGAYKLVDRTQRTSTDTIDGLPDPMDKDLGDDFGAALDSAEYAYRQRLLVKKIDRRIMPCLFAMIVLKYVFSTSLNYGLRAYTY